MRGGSCCPDHSGRVPSAMSANPILSLAELVTVGQLGELGKVQGLGVLPIPDCLAPRLNGL